MTAPAEPGGGAPTGRPRHRLVAIAAVGVVAVAALGVGLGLSLSSSRSQAAGATRLPYAYYRSVIGRYGPGSMMGGGAGGWTMGRGGYAWMVGGTRAPAWMRGQSLPGFMMGGGDDPGSVMGRIFSDAPGPRVSPEEANRLGSAVPAGATADRAANRLRFAGSAVRLVVLASPSMPAENFRIAGMTDPTVVVPAGARVSVELVNADSDMAHGLVVTVPAARSDWMPMMAGEPAFPGAALWFLGESTAAGMQAGTFSFTASRAGTYDYLCPVPGHAEEGMEGSFVVAPAR